jgi:hypothetical protein
MAPSENEGIHEGKHLFLPRVDNRAVADRAVDLHALACDGRRRYHLCVSTGHFEAMISVRLAPAGRWSTPPASTAATFTPMMLFCLCRKRREYGADA